VTRPVSADEAHNLLNRLVLAGIGPDALPVNAPSVDALAATVIALSEERDAAQEYTIRLTEENVKLLRWQSVAAAAHLDHLCAMVMSLAANDETPRALRSISAEGVVSELRRTFDAERVNRAKSEAESVALRRAAEDMEGRALDAEKERDEARDERDRLRAILACERGEAAPEGWAWTVEHEEGSWVRTTAERRADVNLCAHPDEASTGRLRWHWWWVSGGYEDPEVHSDGWADSALEAIEAADRAANPK
jgi:hypothetical protein